ncbi:MAG: hypothetical protein HC923_03885 [Myxococcales bacterium]|nr:hypothetical protein [Myxococcales bacterium]
MNMSIFEDLRRNGSALLWLVLIACGFGCDASPTDELGTSEVQDTGAETTGNPEPLDGGTSDVDAGEVAPDTGSNPSPDPTPIFSHEACWEDEQSPVRLSSLEDGSVIFQGEHAVASRESV